MLKFSQKYTHTHKHMHLLKYFRICKYAHRQLHETFAYIYLFADKCLQLFKSTLSRRSCCMPYFVAYFCGQIRGSAKRTFQQYFVKEVWNVKQTEKLLKHKFRRRTGCD